MNRKEYLMPDGERAIFEYDFDGVGKITLEAMDMLMGMIADRPKGEWIEADNLIKKIKQLEPLNNTDCPQWVINVIKGESNDR